jgi:excisionase family DNA binding protein
MTPELTTATHGTAMDDPEEAVTVAVAARRLGCDPSTVRAMVRNGQLAAFKVGKGRQPGGVRIEAESIRTYKRKNAIGGETTKPDVSGRSPRSRAHSAAMRELEAELRALGLSV